MCNKHKNSRREFLKKVSLAAAGTFLAPTILPSGRLFAATGARKANHVVFCLFAGGVRQMESIQQADGNLMRYTLSGTQAISPDIIGGMSLLPSPTGLPLQNYGTLFKQFRYNNGPTGHVSGHHTAMTGVYNANDLNINMPPTSPTVFEYYRKHTTPSMSALNAWWISDSLGPYPALNFSSDSNYGALYGANYIQPAALISQSGFDALGNPKLFSPPQKTAVTAIRSILDKNFGNSYSGGDAGVVNTAETDLAQLEMYIKSSFSEAITGQYNDPWLVGASVMNNDMFNIFIAENILKEFKPELLAVNMQGVDVCHTNFTQYCNNIRKADFALAHLWNTIQSTPGLMNDTILIAVPEHGRNSTPNTVMDAYGRYAIDHTNDPMSREIFCLVLGPAGVVKQNQVINTLDGESIDVVPTIADILGFYSDIPANYKGNMGAPLAQAFV
ncbi:MAG: hypothetical protein EPN85_08900 [Bacteroidetes bacterium]|nr:MAG: hypothetical protein EPN85_08900 [Bacteroidota bacterium]